MPYSRLTILSISLLATASVMGAAITPENAPSLPLETTLEIAEKGEIVAIHEACYRYMYGVRGAPRDRNLAFSWCEKGASYGIPSSITLLAELYYLGDGVSKDMVRARALYVLAANLGHPHAALIAAHMFWNGDGGPIDLATAKYYLDSAALGGVQQASRLRQRLERNEPPPPIQ